MRFCQMTGSATDTLSAFRFAIRRPSLLLSLRQRLSCCTLRLFQNATNPLCQPRVLEVRRELLWSRILTQLGTSGFYQRRKVNLPVTGSAHCAFCGLPRTSTSRTLLKPLWLRVFACCVAGFFPGLVDWASTYDRLTRNADDRVLVSAITRTPHGDVSIRLQHFQVTNYLRTRTVDGERDLLEGQLNRSVPAYGGKQREDSESLIRQAVINYRNEGIPAEKTRSLLPGDALSHFLGCRP
jgi:hypothetical protein